MQLSGAIARRGYTWFLLRVICFFERLLLFIGVLQQTNSLNTSFTVAWVRYSVFCEKHIPAGHFAKEGIAYLLK
jgi:hypothetical protein